MYEKEYIPLQKHSNLLEQICTISLTKGWKFKILNYLCNGFRTGLPLHHTELLSQGVIMWLAPVTIPGILIDIFLKVYLFTWEREREWALVCAWGEGRRISFQTPRQAWSPLWGWIPWPWDHDLSWNQQSGAYSTEPPKCSHIHTYYRAMDL